MTKSIFGKFYLTSIFINLILPLYLIFIVKLEGEDFLLLFLIIPFLVIVSILYLVYFDIREKDKAIWIILRLLSPSIILFLLTYLFDVLYYLSIINFSINFIFVIVWFLKKKEKPLTSSL